jgi:hypothetical protein
MEVMRNWQSMLVLHNKMETQFRIYGGLTLLSVNKKRAKSGKKREKHPDKIEQTMLTYLFSLCKLENQNEGKKIKIKFELNISKETKHAK